MLKEILEKKAAEVARDKQARPLSSLLPKIRPGSHGFLRALQESPWSLIAECKTASPVKGHLSNAPVGELATLYEENGATALSVLTDSHFNGRLEHVEEAKKASALPILRKDFMIDEYQIYQARAVGADAILLIAAVLTDAQINRYLALAAELGMDCLTEVHTREELERVQKTPAEIIGVNNRDLKTFQTSVENTFKLLPFCDFRRVIISESGIQSRNDAARLKAAGIRGALVGEGLVRAAHIPLKVQELSLREVEEIRHVK